MIYAIAWLVPIVLFWLLLREAPMLFFLIVYIWYPLLASIFSYKLVSKNNFGVWKWISPLAFGIINASVFYITYGITNTLSMSNVAWDDKANIVMNAIASIVGLVIGVAINHLNKRLKKSSEVAG